MTIAAYVNTMLYYMNLIRQDLNDDLILRMKLHHSVSVNMNLIVKRSLFPEECQRIGRKFKVRQNQSLDIVEPDNNHGIPHKITW